MEKSDDYVEKTPDYGEISKINLVVPFRWLFSMHKIHATSYREF